MRAIDSTRTRGRREGRALVLGLLALLAPAARAETAQPAAPPPAVVAPAEQQPRTLLARPIHHGAYGAPVVSYTRFAAQDGVLVGARGGWIINHQLVLGGGGFGLATPADDSTNGPDYRHTFGYGGFWLEYLIAPMNLVHASVGTMIGGGSITYERVRPEPMANKIETSSVFVLDPVAAVEVNVTKVVRFAVQGGYRVVRGVDLASLTNRQASGVTLGAAVKFGGF